MSRTTILDRFNEDCWRLVLDLLPLGDIIRSEQVSRGWQQVILQYLQSACFSIEYPWYSHEGNRKFHILKMHNDDPEQLENLTKKWGACIKKADCINEVSLKVLRRNCPNLEEITFYGLPVSILSNESPKTFKRMKRAHFRGCDSVRIPYHLNSNECFAFCGLTALIFKSYFMYSICDPQLTDKCIKHWLCKGSIEEVTVWGSERITGNFLSSVHAAKLKAVCLKECEALEFHHLMASVNNMLGLVKLELVYVPRTVFQSVHLLLEKLPSLEDLCLRWEKKMEMGGDLAECVGRMRLRRLDVSFNPNVTDEWLQTAASGFGRLEELLVEGCLGVTARGVRAACVSSNIALRGLHVGSNRNILDKDVVDVLRTCPDLVWLDVSYCCHLSVGLVELIAASRPARPLRLGVENTTVETDEGRHPWLVMDHGD